MITKETSINNEGKIQVKCKKHLSEKEFKKELSLLRKIYGKEISSLNDIIFIFHSKDLQIILEVLVK